jgi:hypothetical protein
MLSLVPGILELVHWALGSRLEGDRNARVTRIHGSILVPVNHIEAS